MDSYEEVPMIKTFRGLIADGDQDTIVLHTNTGATGYRIKKFQVICKDPPGTAPESVITIWKTSQTSAPLEIDFSNNELLGCAYYSGGATASISQDIIIVFDSEIFNQDIYINHNDAQDSGPMNYYLELEQVKLNMDENTVATLKDIRNVTAP
jgi:hypothetical protein